MMKKSFLLFTFAFFCLSLFAQDFDKYFIDKTLRLDYIFSGDTSRQMISLDKLNVMPSWYGKRQRLSELPLEGNGQITLKDHSSREVIYRNSFSTLFQEWLTYDEAKDLSRAFENVFLVPMPKDTVDVTIDLFDNTRKKTASLTHTINPTDILIRHIGEDHVTPYVTLQEAKDMSKCIHIAIIAEGYTDSELETFIDDATQATEAIFEHEPFLSRREDFNVIAVLSVSSESGTSTPSKGIWRDTALNSHFDTFYSNRYLTTLNIEDLHDELAGTPYEHIIILVNTSEYGGGGIFNSYVLSMTHHNQFKPVVVHEFGHSFGGLADEYAYESEPLEMYPIEVEPWEKNITTLVDFHGKWEDMIPQDTPVPTPESNEPAIIEQRIGLFEGAGYRLKGVYRGVQDCRMRTNESPEFCAVCRKSLEDLIDFYVK